MEPPNFDIITEKDMKIIHNYIYHKYLDGQTWVPM